ncbi:MAG TPA: RcnB family protein [Acidobacteriaceae bacterium]
MKRIEKFIALSTISAVLSTGAIFAQDDHRDDHHDADRRDDHHDNHQYVRHDEWRKGYHMRHEDWDRGERVDYNTYHLRRPPRGYEWREVDGNFVLAAVATGVVASIVAANAAH